MCQNDDLKAADKAMQELREGWIAGNLHVAFKTLTFDKRTRKVTSTMYYRYAWAPGWNAPPPRRGADYSRDSAGLHAFTDEPPMGEDGVTIPVLVYNHDVLHYGANDSGTPTILATRLYLPDWAFMAVVRGRDIRKPNEVRLRRTAGIAAGATLDIQSGTARVSTGTVQPMPKPVKAKKRKK